MLGSSKNAVSCMTCKWVNYLMAMTKFIYLPLFCYIIVTCIRASSFLIKQQVVIFYRYTEIFKLLQADSDSVFFYRKF